ncbi:MAG: hypothetical protein ACKO1U_04035 [Bacteroidota bacterium]
MQSQDNKTDYQEQGPKKGIVIIVITILLGTNGLLLWQFFDKKSRLDDANKTIYSTTAERDALQVELKQVKAEFEKAKSDNSSLQSQLSEREEEIKAKTAEIQRLIALGGPAQIARAKAELAELRALNDSYVAQLDSLNQVAARLQAENTDLNSNLNQERSKNENLSAQNSMLTSKVAAGSILKAVSLVSEGVRTRSNGKESITDRAKQVQKLRTRFTLVENKVIDRGPVDLFIRVVGPDGVVLSSMQDVLNINGQSMNYTMKETVDYNNQDTPVEVSWSKGSVFSAGIHNIEIYHQGVMIGKSSITLK